MAQPSAAQVSSWLSQRKYKFTRKVEVPCFSKIVTAVDEDTKDVIAVKLYNCREHDDEVKKRLRVQAKLETTLHRLVREGVSTLIGNSRKRFFTLHRLTLLLLQAFLTWALLIP